MPVTLNRAVSVAATAVLCLLTSTVLVVAGQERVKPSGASRGTRSQKQASSSRRTKALALLNECADSVSSIDDPFYRARIECQIAQTYWPVDHTRSRLLFRKAWESAKRSDLAEQEEYRQKYGEANADGFTEARDEVLKAIAERDPKMANLLSREIYAADGNRSQDDASKTTQSLDPWHTPSPLTRHRLALADELLNEGKFDSAAQLAQPAVAEGVSGDLVAFVIKLRNQSPPLADGLLTQLVAMTARQTNVDANSVLLLTAPLISPTSLAVVDGQGSLLFRSLPPLPATGPAQFSSALQSSVFATSATILLRLADRVEASGSAAEPVAFYFAIARLLPFFEHGAAEFVPALRARQQQLADLLAGGRKSTLDGQAKVNTASSGYGDPLRSQSDELARAGDTAARDQVLLAIVKTAVRNRLWDRARRAAAEIKDPDLQRASGVLIAAATIGDISRAYREDKENDYEGILSYVRRSNAPPFVLAWGFAQVAEIAARKDGAARAAEIIEEGERVASAIPESTRERLAGYAVLATAAARYNKERTWILVREVVRAANSLEAYTGDEDSFELLEGGSAGNLSIDGSAFRIDDLFEKMGRFDFNEAVIQARALTSPTPRLLSMHAIARSGLAGPG
jgi:hypothetical protein